LVLKNNIDIRTAHRNKTSDKALESEALNEAVWNQLDDTEHQILAILKENDSVCKKDIVGTTGRADRTIARKLSHLLQLEVIKLNGNKYDKNHTYSINGK
jgi:predicted HTH transcriptional regulator